MQTRAAEVAPGIYQLATHIAEIDFGMNQYVVAAEQPLLFHTGPRSWFPHVSQALESVLPVSSLRWISFGHVESDECGAMNHWLAAAPDATVVHGQIGCMVSLDDLADRPPRPLADGEAIDIGGHRMRWIDTPHVPHAWEAGVMYDETTGTLFCGDLFTQTGAYPPTSSDDVLSPSLDDTGYLSMHPSSGAVVRRLAELDVRTLALMHGPAYTGDCRAALLGLADHYDQLVRATG